MERNKIVIIQKNRIHFNVDLTVQEMSLIIYIAEQKNRDFKFFLEYGSTQTLRQLKTNHHFNYFIIFITT